MAPAAMNIEMLLKMAVEKKASDLFITSGLAPSIRVQGRSIAVSPNIIGPQKAREMVMSVMSEDQRAEFTKTKECNFAITTPLLGRFRVSAFQQRNQYGMVIRRIESYIPTYEELGLPQSLKKDALAKKGLIIFVGATGSGKSSSMAALVGYRNANSTGHIITIEDPIEFVHQHDGCIITQREVGIDTESFDVALRNSLRQAPDVIMIGEIRNSETMNFALEFAETGHLCVATLHANNANQALDRIQHFFHQDKITQMWMSLSMNLQCIVAQQLVPRKDEHGLVLAVEILSNSPVISDKVREGKIAEVKEYMSRANETGMKTFDQSLYELYKDGLISMETAISHADSANNVRLLIKLGEERKSELDEKTKHFSIKLDDRFEE